MTTFDSTKNIVPKENSKDFHPLQGRGWECMGLGFRGFVGSCPVLADK